MISHKGMALIKFVLVVLVCMFVSGDATQVGCIKREREALLSFKDGLIDEYGILSSWRSDDCCKWYGVECSNATGHVVALQLDAANYDGVLQGKVGSSLLELYHLNIFDLIWNDFGGSPIPKFIGSMKQLQQLYLRSCNFSGIVPPEIGNLTNLLSLDLSLNDFGGNPIPESVGSMKQLQSLYLKNSNFSGIVPPQIGNLTNLLSLDLSYNSLRIRENPDWLSSSSLSFLSLSGIDVSHANKLHHILNLPSLQELHLESCNLTDVSVKVYYPFPNSSYTNSLSILDLKDNQLTRSSLDWLSNMNTSLVKVDLSGNALSGPIPSEYFERGSLTLIEHIDLSSNTLEGEIPKSLANLSHVHVLVLYNNSFRGGFHRLFGNQTISGKGITESLQILDLAENQLNGAVPDLRPFTALTEVHLGWNNFTGSMPLSLGQLSKLRALDISGNSLEGTVSESHFIKLDSLKILDLSSNSGLKWHVAPEWSPPFQLWSILLAGCSVGPSFPKWIKTQRNLRNLDLSSAAIVDEAPRWLWNASPVLEDLFLSLNQISGTIPNLSSTVIVGLDLAYNNFSGPIPLFHTDAHAILLNGNRLSGSISSLCEILHNGLWMLDLSDNKLEGEVPNCLEKMPNLLSLNLAANNFRGEIPPSLGSLGDLQALQLHGNKFSGDLPSTLRHCQHLQLIDVGGNRLTGEIPDWIGDLQEKMLFVNLGRNNLHGSIPREICKLTLIRILDLSLNNLSGEMPDCFHNFINLAQNNIPPAHPSYVSYGYTIPYNPELPNIYVNIFYEYSWFQWKGQKSEYRKSLSLLKLIDLSSNRLSGNVPQSFSSMRGLISLNLSRNSFTGNIIPDIGEMERLECLDLSHNRFSGKIPASTAKLQFLSVLDLSDNSLSGKIPSSTQLQSFNASSYAENARLCGPPLASCPEDSLRPSFDTTPSGENTNGDERDDDIFSFMQEVCISMAFGFIIGFWGIIGFFILKRSWRIAYFNLLDDAGDWFHVRTYMLLSKWRPT